MTAPRLQGLDPAAAQRVVSAAQALELGRVDQAAAQLAPALAMYPDHPEVLRLYAGILNLRGDNSGARAAMQRAVSLRPMDALYHNTLGTVLGAAGDFDAATPVLRRACELQPDLAVAWYNLGLMLTQCGRNVEAAEALRRAVELDSGNMDARAQLGDLLRMQGRVEAAAAEYRNVLAARPWTGMAWWGLADLRSGALTGEDIDRMRSASRDNRASDDDRIAIGFAMAKALDEQARYDESLGELQRANAIARRRRQWDPQAFSASIDAVDAAFDALPPSTPATDSGREAIFIVGMPRSGTTLIEQILASHSQVEGAGELHDLPQVLAEESHRRGQPLWRWVAEMQSADWQRLGARYLERTAHWRKRRPQFTDKLPNNWMSIAAIRRMLPAARIVVCRRDPVETCFSCYRQYLAGNEYSRTLADLAAFWRDFNRSTAHWARLFPKQVYQHDYEALVANPQPSVRRLLDFCGLQFEEACLRFYANEREVRSPSATQVRKPLDAGTARTQRYGTALDPLRAALGLPLFKA